LESEFDEERFEVPDTDIGAFEAEKTSSQGSGRPLKGI